MDKNKENFKYWLNEKNINNSSNFENCCYLLKKVINTLDEQSLNYIDYDRLLMQFSFYIYKNSKILA